MDGRYMDPNSLLRCGARLIEVRTAAADMLELIHSGALVPANDTPALLDYCTQVADRLARACAPETLKPLVYQD